VYVEKTTTLILLDLQLEHNFIDCTGISTIDINTGTGSDASAPRSTVKSKQRYDRQSVGQSVLVSGAHLGPVTNFTFSFKYFSDSCGFFNFVALCLTRGRSAIYCTITYGPCQSSHS
jgi:hypothetical protein